MDNWCIFRQIIIGMAFSILDSFQASPKERRRRHLLVLLAAIAISWTLWCIVSIPYYRDFSGVAFWKEIGIDFAEHIVEATLLIELSLLFCLVLVRFFWNRIRSFWQMIAMLLILAVFNILCAYGVAAFYRWVYPENATVFWRVFYSDSAMTSVLSTACLISFLVSRHREEELAKQEADDKAKAEELIALRSKLDSLALQADNHFVFNSFNTLYNLIPVNPDDAQKFTLHLSHIYRYLVSNTERHLVPLNAELDFTRDYTDMLQWRYQGVSVETAPKLNTLDCYVIPVSLQMLVENALKHNRHGKNELLLIKIYREDDYIVVENNILPRHDPPAKSGHGLGNLSSRYKLLCGRDIIIDNNTERFMVGIPIIDTEETIEDESSNY